MMHDFVDSKEPPRPVFRTIDMIFGSRALGTWPGGTFMAPWEEEFEAFILCWLVQMGHTDWEPIARWKVGSSTARTDGKSGWPRSHATPYVLRLRMDTTTPWSTSWAQAAELNGFGAGSEGTDNDHLFVEKGAGVTYPSYTRGALAMAARMGVAEAKPCFDWLDRELKNYLSGKQLYYKWAIV